MSQRLAIAIVAVVGLAVGYATALWWRPAPPPPDTRQTPPSDFALIDLSGRERRFSEWRGRPVLLNFWATWCAPCREEIPLFIDTRKRHAAIDLEVIGVAIDQASDAAEFASKLEIPYPILIADDSTLALMNRYGNSAGGLPYSVLFRADGTIALRKIGAFRPAELEQAIAALGSSAR